MSNLNSVPSDIVRLMMDVGFAALHNGVFDEAHKIFTGVQAVRDEESYGHVGFALIDFMNARFEEARKRIVESVLSIDPDNVDAKKILLLILRAEGSESDYRSLKNDLERNHPSDEALHAYLKTVEEVRP